MPRKLKSQDGNPYEIIRGMWECAYVSHFIRLFEKKFGFSCLTTQDLEEALIEEESVALADIFARLLRYVSEDPDILIENFYFYLRILLIHEKAEIPHFLDNGTTWHDLAPEEKLGILKWLIDHVYQEKEEDIADFLDENYCADDLRGICAGQDAFNNVYWYLDDLRLYREFPHKKQNKRDWECVCLTITDWQSFIKQFRKTTNLQEKELYSYLNFQLFPIVELQLLQKRSRQSKEEVNKYLKKREREDLDVMLEKRTFLECNNVSNKPDVNGTGSICLEKQNGEVRSLEICLPDFSDLIETSIDCDKSPAMDDCDDHLNIDESVCSISSSLGGSTMDIKSITEANMCANSCSSSNATSCNNNQDASVVSSNANAVSSGKVARCNTSPSAIATTSAMPLSLENTQEEIPPMSAMSNMLGSASTPATTASVQPLPSNMVNKTSFQMETQYMQQQSQIFVFSTALANKAAESYLSGHSPSLIAFHCAQPGTKSFLEKYPLKVQQFNRQNPAVWLNALAQGKQSGRQMKAPINQFPGPHNINNRFPGPSNAPIMSPCSGSCNMHSPGMCSAPRGPAPWPNNCGGPNIGPPMSNELCSQPWPGQQFPQGPSSSPMNHRFPLPQQGIGARPMGPAGSPMCPAGSPMCPAGSPMLGCMNNASVSGATFQNPGLNSMQMNQGLGGPSTLTGVKVPDENLTPQQRQHREEQLAMIRKMQQLLFPEQQHMEAAQGAMGPNMGQVPGGMPPQHASQARFGSAEMCAHPGMDACFSTHQACMSDHDHSHPPLDMYLPNSMMGPGFHQQNFPGGSATAQMEWQKLQHQFYEERRKKQVCGGAPLPMESEMQLNVAPQGQPLQTPQQPMLQPQTPQQPCINSPSPNMGLSPGTRMQGPPPPYHQTNRRTMPSPHPASPNTSSLSLPSPHMTSGLPSPADSSRQFPIPTPPGPRLPHPSPGPTTPVGSSSLHTTPLNSPKPMSTSGPGSNSGALTRTPTTPSNTALTPASTPTSSCAPVLSNSGPATPASSCASSRKQSQPCNSDIQDSNSVGSTATVNTEFGSSCPISTSNNVQGDLFGQSMHSCNPSKPDNCTNPGGICPKEPSLMPVPSPQQIQYLNAFDGQELTIQKQPNTSIRDLDIMSPASIPPSMVMSAGSHSQYQSPEAASFPNTPGSCPSVLENSQDSLSGRYPVSAPASMDSNMQRFTAPSPQMPGFESGPRHMMPSLQSNDTAIPRFPGAPNLDMIRMPGPGSMNHNPLDESSNRFPGPQSQMFGPGPNNMARFPMSASETMQRFRGPSPHVGMDMMHSRFMGSNPHMSCVDNMSQSSQLNSIGSDALPHMPNQSFQNSSQTLTSNSGSCVGNNFMAEGNMPHSHLQNLQKMTPPFESISGNKMPPDVISPLGQCSNSSANGSNMSMQSFDGSNSLPSNSQVGPSQRLSHFDPIASMAAMSETTVPLVTAAGNAQAPQNIINSNMNMTNMQMASNAGNNDQNNMTNFHPNMQSMQSTSACSMPNQRPQFSVHNQMAHNAGCGPQNVNNTFVNATMPVPHMNMQNAVTTAYNNCTQDPNMNPHAMHVGCPSNGANTISCSVTTNHPIMHTSVTTRTNSNMSMPGPRHGPQNFPGQPNVQRTISPAGAGSPTMMGRGAPFNSPNVQVKAGAPNTIQYLPARQQNPTAAPGRGSTLEFLQRFAPPLTNLDNKVPTHNLQYFPNSGGNHPPVGMNSNPANIAPGMMNNQRPVNMMMGPMMRGTSPNVPHPGGQMFPVGAGHPNADSSMFGRPPCPGNQMMPMNAMGGGQNVAMFSNKQMPLPMGGMAPDATQPLPPSMGQSFNYKQSPFYGPTTADPNYAVQFHNFQQQLYATNTRGSQMNSQNNMAGQGFFGAK